MTSSLLSCAARPTTPAKIIEVETPAIIKSNEIDLQKTIPSPTVKPSVTPTAILPLYTPTPTPSYVFTGNQPACGQLLPILSPDDNLQVAKIDPNLDDLAYIEEIIPDEHRAVLEYILKNPESTGLAAYHLGEESQGVFLNADNPMPLASVVKILHLIAYAEAAASGDLEPTATVNLEDLDSFYLPTTDLGSHQRALAALEDEGRVFGNPQAILLDEVPGMMIEYSSNAATDYLHLLLGQTQIEETAVIYDITTQTAPCPFVGQFLIMANHTRPINQTSNLIENYINNPEQYGKEVMQLTEAFSSDQDFRQDAIEWRLRTRLPNGQTQRVFSDTFNARGSARDYARLMAIIAQNGLSSSESSYITRKFLEWPMRFDANQALFTNLGYKNGSLPGILTTAYYAYPIGDPVPIVVTLFFRGLDGQTYREWRNSQAHDEFARWLLADPTAIPALRKLLEE